MTGRAASSATAAARIVRPSAPGHAEVGDDDVRLHVARDIAKPQRFAERDARVSLAREQSLAVLEHRRFVVDYENAGSFHVAPRGSSGSVTTNRHPPPGPRVECDRAAMPVDDAAAHGEPESGAAAGLLRREEGLEHAFAQAGRHAGTGVAHLDLGGFAIGAGTHRQRDGSARRRRVRRVEQEVDDHRLDRLLVPDDRRHRPDRR